MASMESRPEPQIQVVGHELENLNSYPEKSADLTEPGEQVSGLGVVQQGGKFSVPSALKSRGLWNHQVSQRFARG
jgi:hypothetical protein